MFISKLLDNCSKYGNQVSLISKNGEQFTWTDYLMKVVKLASSMKSLGISKGDSIIIQGNNSPKWFWVAMASMYLNCILIPLPVKNIDSQRIKKIIKNNKVSFIFCDYVDSWKTQKSKYIIQILSRIEKKNSQSKSKRDSSNHIFTWNQFLELGGDNYIKPVTVHNQDIVWRLAKESTWSSNNQPQLFSISYQQLESVVSTYQSNYGLSGGKMISYLNLTQINVLIFDFLYSLDSISTVYFCDDQTKDQIPLLIREIKSVQPIFFYSVPVIWNQLKHYYKQQLHQFQFYFSTHVLFQAIQFINHQFHSNFHGKQKNTIIFYIFIGLYYICKWITGYFKKKIGFHKCQIFTNIYEHLNSETLKFFCGLDMPIYHIYGTLETSGLISLGNIYSTSDVGFPIMQVSITDENQILVKGRNLNETVRDERGWFYTGDCGKLLEDGQLQIFGPENENGHEFTKIEFFFKNNIDYVECVYVKKNNYVEDNQVDIYFMINYKDNQNQDIPIWINKFNNNWREYHFQINDFKIINQQDTFNEKCRDSLGKLQKNWFQQFL